MFIKLIQDKLQKLAEKKESLEKELEVLIQMEKDSRVIAGARKYIEMSIKAAKANFKKAKLNLQKKLLGAVFGQLTATDLGLGVDYVLSEEMATTGKHLQMKKPSGLISDGFSSIIQRTADFLMSTGSPVVVYGGTNRT